MFLILATVLYCLTHERRRTRLSLQSEANQFFSELLLSTVFPEEVSYRPTPISSVQKRLLSAMEYFQGFLGQRSEDLIKIKALIEERLDIVQFCVSDASDVAMMFEVVNNRGLPISEMDKLKNWLLRLARVDLSAEPTLPAFVNEKWSLLIPNLEASRFINEDLLLKYFWLTAYNPNDLAKWKKEDASGNVRRHFELSENKNAESFGKYMNGLAAVSEVIAQFPQSPDQDPEVRIAMKCPDLRLRRSLQRVWLDIYRVSELSLVYSVIMAVQLHFGTIPAQVSLWRALNVALQAFLVYQIRMSVFRQGMARAGKQDVFRASHQLASGRLDFAGFIQELKAIEGKYVTAVSLEFDNWYESNKFTKLLLWLREEHHNPDASLLGYGELELEHILPQDARGSAWLKGWTEADSALLTHDIGNLSLCRTGHNPVYGNQGFADKKGTRASKTPCYATSSLWTELDLLRFSEWTAVSARNRHHEIENTLKELFDWTRVATLIHEFSLAS